MHANSSREVEMLKDFYRSVSKLRKITYFSSEDFHCKLGQKKDDKLRRIKENINR